jgi:plastocyanin
MRFVTQQVHAILDYPVAANLIITPFLLNLGEAVEWKNDGFVPHTVSADGGKPAFDSGKIDPGSTWRYVAQKKGTYNYNCDYHPNMTGKLIVQ